jgi:hypothetical protein
MELTKEEFDKQVRELINPQTAKKPKIVNLLDLVAKDVGYQHTPMANSLPVEKQAQPEATSPMATQAYTEEVNTLKQYPFLQRKL